MDSSTNDILEAIRGKLETEMTESVATRADLDKAFNMISDVRNMVSKMKMGHFDAGREAADLRNSLRSATADLMAAIGKLNLYDKENALHKRRK